MRHDMVTHYTVNDLRAALGFAKTISDEEITPRAGDQLSPLPQAPGKNGATDGGPRRGPDPTRPECAALTRRFLMRPSPPTRRSLMRRAPSPLILDRTPGCCLLALCLLTPLAAPGCGHKEKTDYTRVSKPPIVRIIQPEVRKIVRVVGQPSFIESLSSARRSFRS